MSFQKYSKVVSLVFSKRRISFGVLGGLLQSLNNCAWACCCLAALVFQEVLFANWGPPCRVLADNISQWFAVFFLLYRCVFGFAILCPGSKMDIHCQETFVQRITVIETMKPFNSRHFATLTLNNLLTDSSPNVENIQNHICSVGIIRLQLHRDPNMIKDSNESLVFPS